MRCLRDGRPSQALIEDQAAVDGVRQAAFQAPQGFLGGLALGQLALLVGLPGAGPADLDHGHQQLAAAGEQVLDVPATLAARARLLSTGGGRKSDAADAASVGQVALHNPMLRVVKAEDQTTILRLLAERRDDLAGERTRILNRLHGLLRDLLPGGAPTDLTAAKAAALLRRLRPTTATAACRRQLARDLLGDLRRVDARLADNKVQLQEALRRPVAP